MKKEGKFSIQRLGEVRLTEVVLNMLVGIQFASTVSSSRDSLMLNGVLPNRQCKTQPCPSLARRLISFAIAYRLHGIVFSLLSPHKRHSNNHGSSIPDQARNRDGVDQQINVGVVLIKTSFFFRIYQQNSRTEMQAAI